MFLHVSIKLVLGGGRDKVEQFLNLVDQIAVNLYSEYLLAFIFCPE